MITALRNNKKLLRKKSLFRPERTFLSLKKEYLKAANGEIEFKKATKEQLIAIRTKIKKRRKKETYTIVLIFFILFSSFCFLIYSLIMDSIDTNEKTQKIELKKKTEESLNFIADGDNWLKNKNWQNAIFQYKKALEIFPTDYSINYRLAYAYSLRCENEYVDCQNAKNLIDKLINQFPQKIELLALKETLKYEY